MVLLIVGVSGVGKTTIGAQVARELGIPFFDADDFHPASNIERMKSGIPLDDDDRQPWIETLAKQLSYWQKASGAVLACSALKKSYREILEAQCDERPLWLFLHAPKSVLASRLAARKGHFFDQRLLHTQLDELEAPDDGWLIDASQSEEEIVGEVLSRIRADESCSTWERGNVGSELEKTIS